MVDARTKELREAQAKLIEAVKRKYGLVLDPKTYPSHTLTYKIKNIFPPQFWDSLPVKIDGKQFPEYVFKTGKMIHMLEPNGIITDVTDEQVMLTKFCGESVKDFSDGCARAFYTGDWVTMRQKITKVNNAK